MSYYKTKYLIDGLKACKNEKSIRNILANTTATSSF
jgi:hypothetical protein